eukprot:Protomagalhaensia_sp_Gyna_25__5151@NODE_605_length_3029_cov_7_218060_g468_i0_p1_GENE_NODE_605_length_3029_cov_7_218060_g468_i0NODE_605_length_3029_cov_7_218060_g468_i0_p1_ORF_typecomplete_len482_score37_00Mannosyl_trans/PF05007_13/9_6e02Mannosyl_trans/PF05007_13/1_9e62PIGU/PF06728_13/7_9e28PIGU/PF06728_13/2_3GT87/PF09594_10/1e13GT87/PF09594_10/8e03PMT_2/PF13231_6/1_6e08PMT_2/PF13231_6/1_5e02PMT_2/PF13231_6/1_8e04Pmp3/PF01679_17/8_1Pmp3/PF01679_17/27_NODE_605_length_3029_cov_7_218060_g468_i018716
MSTKETGKSKGMFWLSGLVHISFIAYGLIQDWRSDFKYTDIDYAIYNGGARGMLHKSADPIEDMMTLDTFQTRASPYWRSTYRYSPIMALLVLPDLWIGPLFGKLLFSAFNLLTGWMVQNILKLRQVEPKSARILLALWLLNPLAIQVATRGNADSVVTCLVTSLLYFVLKKNSLLAGLCLGLAVHVKIFPALYAFPLLMVWNESYTLENLRQDLFGGIQIESPDNLWKDLWRKSFKLSSQLVMVPWRFVYRFIRRLNRDQWIFGLSALVIFALVTGGCYLKYGWTFLFETYLYHGLRHDHRHNFSPFSAWATLVTPRRDPTEEGNLVASAYGSLAHFKLVQKLAQLPLTLLLGFVFIRSAPELSLFLQTAWFVTFNSVSTAQYFVWYLALLPLALGTSKRIQNGQCLKQLWLSMGIVMLIWLAADLHWVYWSHRFEYRGESDAFLGMFVATLAFTGATVLLMNFVLKWSSSQPIVQTKED